MWQEIKMVRYGFMQENHLETRMFFCASTEKKVMVLSWHGFKGFGLNKNDFDNLKWEDEPLEVFITLND